MSVHGGANFWSHVAGIPPWCERLFGGETGGRPIREWFASIVPEVFGAQRTTDRGRENSPPRQVREVIPPTPNSKIRAACHCAIPRGQPNDGRS